MSSVRISAASKRVAALLASALVVAGPALAQTPPAKPAPAQPAKPAQPAQPAQPPAQGGQPMVPAGPTVVQLKPEPTQTDWLKICGEDQAAKKKVCYVTRDFVSDQGQPVLAVAVYDVQGDPQKVVRFLMPLALLLGPGIRFGVDAGQTTAGKYAICFPNGCFAEGTVKDDVINALKKGTTLNVSVQNQFSREVSFQVPLTGFGKAFDGPPIDPAVLEQQQRQMEEEMRKQAEEMRKRMEQQQGQQGGGAPAPAAPAAPAQKQ